jgi:PKD repeat protein
VTTETGSSTILAVDFTATGCPMLSLRVPFCTGRAPVTLTFIPITTMPAGRYLWDFGDGTPRSSEATPTHTYPLPGSFSVTLVVAGTGGTVSKSHDEFVVTTPNQVGDSCLTTAQCQPGLVCACGAALPCGAPAARGICTVSCSDKDCPGSSVCVDLTLSATSPAPWQQPSCLRRCASDKECDPDLYCREVPARRPSGGWIKACFAPVLAEAGESCRTAAGQLKNDLCATGQCADLGANGVCSFGCTTAACPSNTVCAEMASGEHLCLRPCSASFTCDDDPLLGCVAPDPTGPFGFQVPSGTPAADYCAPRRCALDADCGPTGKCTSALGGSQCVRR